MDALSAFLRVAMRQRFEVGIWDCGLMCADWYFTRRGVDPAADWRGRYHTPRELARLVKRRGGMVAHFDAALVEAGATRTDAPQRGDIAIVETEQGQTGAIVTGTNLVMVAADQGLISRHRALAPQLAAWRV